MNQIKQWFQTEYKKFDDWFYKANSKNKATSIVVITLLMTISAIALFKILSIALTLIPEVAWYFIFPITVLVVLWLFSYWLFELGNEQQEE